MSRTIQSCVWRLRRIAAGLRQLDVCLAAGISQARFSGIERGEVQPTEAEQREVERILPPLPRPVVEELRMGHSP